MRWIDHLSREDGAPSPLERNLLLLILLGALIVRLAALAVLNRPPESDGAAYLRMAQTAIAGPEMRDIYGNLALYSPGYPLFLTLPFRLFGADVGVARAVNLLLGLAAVALAWGVGRRAANPLAGLIAAAGCAVLVPLVASIDVLEREHLSVPLLLLFVLLAMRLPDSRRAGLIAAAAGLVFGYGLLTGISSLFAGIAVAVALWQRRRAGGTVMAPALAFAVAAALVVAPYIARNAAKLGAPVFSTNGGINLYVGNNPTATGGYVAPSDTPAGRDWKATRARLGELGHDTLLKQLAFEWMAAHPVETALLDVKKLVLFWAPDTPDAGDADGGGAIRAIRWAGAAQHVLALALALVAFAGWRWWRPGLWVVAAALVGFWGMHGIVYVMARYRTPAMPLVLVLAAVPVAALVARRRSTAPLPA
ncbi:glycosyltransferase family 39 protein [Sphingomonas jatrophae]|uniref:Dolichyl-phosphate-mannose-protein mannosyltransferase n=1 Tax=Sphingomonas jatrophae TaxID=1166337 RepID=A0A1I6LGD0_9SPHN|nr:glycosyltransferase family 39 protein [Sphingomonas jatrophae]SFS02507.1 Dolichyl-phosphate-mannose-protein mannosyltransferase [Sphingomonas jatrophae]